MFERFLDARVLRNSNPKDLKITYIVSLNWIVTIFLTGKSSQRLFPYHICVHPKIKCSIQSITLQEYEK